MDYRQPLKKVLRDKFPTVTIDDTIETALRTMARDDSSALLVKKNEDLVGIITISDIMYSLANQNDPKEIRVSSFMTSCELITNKPNKTPCVQLDEDMDILSAK